MSLNVPPDELPEAELDPPATGEQNIVIAGGCFWCVEAVYRKLRGVSAAVSGYAGGTAATANYKDVCSGRTAHAEVLRITYDAGVISLGRILQIFFAVGHDPTHVNRQGNDVGPQYRSAVFYADDAQLAVAEAYIRQLNEAQVNGVKVFRAAIATKLEPLEAFYPAEGYHQNYAELNPNQAYICAVADPKVEKLRHYYGDWVKGAPA
jgi:peptide-methionine (S)-S-oxide reductase